MTDATIIKPKSLGLQFTERMSGFIAPGDTDDYAEAFRRGKEADASFVLLATILADDLDRFLSEPAHKAKLTGTVNAPSLSLQPMEILDGTFNLFLEDPTNVNARKLVYEMKLDGANGQQLFVYGYKFVHDDPGLDAWKDTTTLFVTVCENGKPGTPAGKLVAKGIITISLPDFAKELTTIEILNSSGTVQKLEAIARFGRVFAGQMLHI
jgi:cholesterol oxidase